MKEIIDEINVRAQQFFHLELSILSFTKDELVIAGSEDFSYYHNFEIRFRNVFTIISNCNWKTDSSKYIIELIGKSDEGAELNKRYGIEIGNHIFKFTSEDNNEFYIAAKEISFIDSVVRYNQ